MFRLVCYVEDKKLVPVLKMLGGNVLNMEPPTPVNPVSAESVLDVIKSMPNTFTSKELKEKTRQAGFSPGGVPSSLTAAKRAGVVTRLGNGKWRLK